MRKLETWWRLRAATALIALLAMSAESSGDDGSAAGRPVSLGVVARILGEDWRADEQYWASGIMVIEVAPGSPAERGGVTRGDILVSVGSRTMHHPGDLAEAESLAKPGQPVAVVVARDAGRIIRIFNLETGPAAGAEGSADAAPAEAPSQATAELGMRCANLGFDRAAELGAPDGQGVLVLAVTGGSPAEAAGIQEGDVITWVAGQPVPDVARLERMLADAESPLAIVTVRRGTTRPVTAEFATPAPPMAAEPVAAPPVAAEPAAAEPAAAEPAAGAGPAGSVAPVAGGSPGAAGSPVAGGERGVEGGGAATRVEPTAGVAGGSVTEADPLVRALREEVLSLREEIRKLREEFAALARSGTRP